MKTHKYTKKEIDFLKSIIPGNSYRNIQKLFNEKFEWSITLSQIKGFIGNRKLNTGRTGRFEKGNIPANKGTKGITTSNRTSFKKGNKPANWVPLGTEVTKADGYVYVKVKDGNLQKNWKQKHKIIWEEANAPIPKGHYVMFADGNKNNIVLDNLILVSQAQMLIINKNNLIYDDPELTKTGTLIAKVIDKGNKRKNWRDISYG